MSTLTKELNLIIDNKIDTDAIMNQEIFDNIIKLNLLLETRHANIINNKARAATTENGIVELYHEFFQTPMRGNAKISNIQTLS